ncbi:DUF5343 domain-containing protein [Nocardioides sp. SYSU D00038]|uniref:DUF5343 domain-containing protein n=1 Tax=Nocardioides sp. SYSU D00038 TaxID=2812554 RepID=UPI001967C521|nr:DUF5343 domain-containing protein [Nocardioides sp. SYSU D00038]
MAVPSAYLTSTKNTSKILEAMQKASVPASTGFTYEFLKQLGFSSSSDRPIIPVLKAIGFLDHSGTPTELYRTYKDPALAGKALAQGLRTGYADLFAVDNDANKKSASELAGIFARLTDKGEAVTAKMGSTFHALAQLADWTPEPSVENQQDEPDEQLDGRQNGGEGKDERRDQNGGTFSLRHDIHVHLPLSTDVAVYDAIFKSLRENLM